MLKGIREIEQSSNSRTERGSVKEGRRWTIYLYSLFFHSDCYNGFAILLGNVCSSQSTFSFSFKSFLSFSLLSFDLINYAETLASPLTYTYTECAIDWDGSTRMIQ